MNNLQATVELVKMMRQHPDLKDRAELTALAVMAVMAVMATDNLTDLLLCRPRRAFHHRPRMTRPSCESRGESTRYVYRFRVSF